MQKRAKITILVLFLVFVLAATGSLKMYYIRDDGGGTVLWNADEAYFFVNVAERGFRISYLEYPFVVLKQFFYGVRLPDNGRSSVHVIHVTASAVERNVVAMVNDSPGSDPGFYTPFEGRIFANSQGRLTKWADDHFEPATKEEQGQFDGTNRLISDSKAQVNGWFKRDILGGSRSETLTDAAGKDTILEQRIESDPAGYPAFSIYLQRAGQPPESVWYFDGHPRRVSKLEFERKFGASVQNNLKF